MGRAAPPPADEPSNRWPWVALAAGILVIVLAVVFFFFNRSSNVNVTAEGSPTPSQLAAAASPSPPPTLVPPTLAPAASPLVSPAPPSPTPQPSPTEVPPTATAVVPPSPAPPVAASPPAAQATPPAAAATAPGTTPLPAQPTPLAPPSPTVAFAGQVSAGGGLGNTRADIDAAYGSPVGETANHLVVFRSSNFEYHVQFVPDLNGRAALIAVSPVQTGQPLALADAQADAHRLLPRDAEPPNPAPEGNEQFVVERFTSQTLAQALPADAFSAANGQPGQFMIVYARDAQNRITHWVIGPGNDASALLQRAD